MMNTIILKNIIKSLLTAVIMVFYSQAALSFDNSLSVRKSKSKEDVVKILAIGNSFSQDAIESYLYGLAKAGGHKIVIGNLVLGGASLDIHWKNASEGNAVYSYRKIEVDGKKKGQPKSLMLTAIIDEDWDFISLQQASPKSGLYETYAEPLPLLYNYVKKNATNPNVKFIFHQTWAYSQDSKHKGFASYDKDQIKMYNGIMDASSKSMKLMPFSLLIPSGTAVQNARTSFLGDNLCRDGFHLNIQGRYIAACTWYAALFKDKVIGNTCIPAKISAREAEMAQHAAQYAVKKPYKITRLKKFL